jgi:hypothetical protein
MRATIDARQCKPGDHVLATEGICKVTDPREIPAATELQGPTQNDAACSEFQAAIQSAGRVADASRIVGWLRLRQKKGRLKAGPSAIQVQTS